MWGINRQLIGALLLGVLISVSPADLRAEADDPDFLTIGAGYYDFNRQDDEGAEFRLDYRFSEKLWIFKPFLTSAVTTGGQTFLGVGFLVDIYFGNRWVLTPQTSATWYQGENDDQDLGYPLEFRSRLELAYRFDNRSRLGIAIDHSSNAGLGDRNPGTETISLNYSIPTGRFFDMFRD